MTNAEIKKELKNLENGLDDLLEAAEENGATREDLEDLIEALTKLRNGRRKFKA